MARVLNRFDNKWIGQRNQRNKQFLNPVAPQLMDVPDMPVEQNSGGGLGGILGQMGSALLAKKYGGQLGVGDGETPAATNIEPMPGQISTEPIASRQMEPIPQESVNGIQPMPAQLSTEPVASRQMEAMPPPVTQEAPQTQPEEQQPMPESVLTGSRKTKKELEDLESAPLEKRKGLFRRLGTGGWDAVQMAAESGVTDPGQLLGAFLTGGVGSMISPTMNAEISKRLKKKRLQNRYGEEMTMESGEYKRQDEINKVQKGQIDNQGKIMENIRTANKPFYDSITADDMITEEEAKEAEKRGYFGVKPYDTRKRNIRYEGGLPIETFDKGELDPKVNAKLPIRGEETPKTFTSPSGQKYSLTQEKAAQFEMAILQGDADRAMRVLVENNKTQNENITQQNKAAQEKESSLAERDGWMTVQNSIAIALPVKEKALADAKAQVEQLTNSNTATQQDIDKANKSVENLEKEIEGLKTTNRNAMQKGIEAEQRYNRYQMPKNQQTINPNKVPRLSGVKPRSRADFIKAAKNNGLSGDALNRAIAAAERDGIIQ